MRGLLTGLIGLALVFGSGLTGAAAAASRPAACGEASGGQVRCSG